MIGDTGQIVELTYSHLTRQDHINTLHKAQERIERTHEQKEVCKHNNNAIIYKDGTNDTTTFNQDLNYNQPFKFQVHSYNQAIGYIENNSKEPQRVIEYLRQNNISINQLIHYYLELMGINRNDGIVYDLDSTMEFLVSLKGKV